MPTYILKLDFQVYSSNVGAQIINISILSIFKIALSSFKVKNKFA